MGTNQIILSKKVCMLGTFGVGKTSLVRRYVHSVFDDKYLSTIGVQIYQKILSEDEELPHRSGERLKLILWDLANIEKFTPTIRNYFSGSSAAIVVTDLTRPETCDEKQIHLKEFLDINAKAKLIFAGNKHDLAESSSLATDALQKLSATFEAPALLTSAKTGENVNALFQQIGHHLLR